MKEAVIYLLGKEKERVVACQDKHAVNANQAGVDDCKEEVSNIDSYISIVENFSTAPSTKA